MTLTQINRAGLDADALDRVFTIGASGSSAYTFQGEGLNGTVNNPTLYLTRGKTYRFENGSGGHPIRIQSTSGASGTAYNTGVTNNAGSGTVIVEVQHDAPDVLYYQCTSHAAMNGTLYITGALADGGVTTAKLADDAVTAAKIGDLEVGTAALANNAVNSDKLANGAVDTDQIANNAVRTTKINDENVTTTKLANSAVTTAKIADQAVTLAKLEHGTSSNDGKFLRANNGADPSFESVPAGITVNNQADNRVITATGTTDTLNSEADLIYDGASLNLAHGKGIRTNYIRPTSQSNTNTGNASQQYWKIGEIALNGSEGAVITLLGANGYSSGGSNFAGHTTIVLRGGNANTLLGFWWSEAGVGIATISDVRWKYISGVNYELWVSAGPYNNIAPIVQTTGTFDNTNAGGTNSNNAPTGSTALPSNYVRKVGSIDTIEYQSTGTIFKRNISMASGYGIDFSATSDASGMSNELLDDYEEGTWTPDLTRWTGSAWWSNTWDTAPTSNVGVYRKIGNVVYLTFDVQGFDVGSATAGAYAGMNGLPYNSKSTGNVGHLQIVYSNGAFGTNTYTTFWPANNGTTMTTVMVDDNGSHNTWQNSSSARIRGMGFYFTD